MQPQNPIPFMRQMGLTMNEIDRRLHMFNFTEGDRALLREYSEALKEAHEQVIDAFYDRQLSNPDISAIIGDPGTLARLRNALLSFLRTLFAADYSEAYINSRLRIGKVHKTLHVTPKIYMSGVATLQHFLDEAIDTHCSERNDRRAVKKAVHKALLFDTQLVFDAYIDSYQEEMEEARSEVNQYASHLEIKVEALTRQLHEQSMRDALTGLFNRRTFLEYLEREIQVAQRYRLPLCVIYFDLNGFKKVNDTYGHEAGDDVLRVVGDSMLAITRSVDIACRYGGDEFCIIMPRCDRDGAAGPINRLIEQFDASKPHDVTFSIGVVQTGPESFADLNSIMSEADARMYKAKAKAHANPGHYVE